MSNENYQVGFVPNEVYKVQKIGNAYKLIDTRNEASDITGSIHSTTRRNVFEREKAFQAFITRTGKKQYRIVDMKVFENLVSPMTTEGGHVQSEATKSHNEIKDFIHTDSIKLKPRELVMKDIKWKYLVRSAVRAKNIMMTGPSGCGKTLAARSLWKALDRPSFYFNLGATQDPRATLIGNTQFSNEKGTFFSESAFITAIKTPNSIILLDELSRAHPDAWNILMTVLDEGQRYLRLDEAKGSPTVKVADGVTFIATANIGNEYTSTRVIDRAIMDRFVTIEMEVLDDEQEYDLLKYMYPNVDENDLRAVAEIAHHTRQQSIGEAGRLTAMVSTRASVEMCGLLYDGFNLIEAAEISILPFFDNDGADSERVYVTQLIQKYIKMGEKEALFDEQEIGEDEVNDSIPVF